MKGKIQRLFAGLVIGGILICPALAVSPFPDVDETAEYADAIDYLNEIGIMQGDTQGNFNPHQTVTRAEMATVICKLLDETDDLTTDGSVFKDVPASHWANGYIIRAESLGIISGYGNKEFGPSNNVTYEQALTMIVKVEGKTDEAISNGGYPDGFLAIANEDGLTANVQAKQGEFLSRADVAVMVYTYYLNNSTYDYVE